MNRFFLVGIISSIALLSCDNNDDFYNLAKVKKGMTMKEVDAIMGTADSVFIDPADTTQINYRYNGSFGMSDDMHIYIYRSDSTVRAVYDGR